MTDLTKLLTEIEKARIEGTLCFEGTDAMLAALSTILAERGLVVVPAEPTDEMCAAGYRAPQGDSRHADTYRQLHRMTAAPVYCAMIAAAQEGTSDD